MVVNNQKERDQLNERKKDFQEKYLEMYRPPGIIPNQAKLFERSDLPHKEKLWFCNPSSMICVRQQKEMPAFKAKETGQMTTDQLELRCREVNAKMSIGKNLRERPIQEVNFEAQYQSQLPPEAEELSTLVESFKDKDSSKDKEIELFKKNAEDKFRRVKNLIPENKDQISALRMEEFEEGGQFGGRSKGNNMRAANASAIDAGKK